VDGLEEELAGRVRVIRLNVAEPAGQRAHEQYRLEKIPGIILLDGSGQETYRTEGKLPRKQQIRDALA
jgi:3-mercaptopyruvate sulfurtransferase SseA